MKCEAFHQSRDWKEGLLESFISITTCTPAKLGLVDFLLHSKLFASNRFAHRRELESSPCCFSTGWHHISHRTAGASIKQNSLRKNTRLWVGFRGLSERVRRRCLCECVGVHVPAFVCMCVCEKQIQVSGCYLLLWREGADPDSASLSAHAEVVLMMLVWYASHLWVSDQEIDTDMQHQMGQVLGHMVDSNRDSSSGKMLDLK